MASITAYQNGFRVQISVKGRRDSQTFATKRDATAWAARREVEMRDEINGKAGEAKTLKDAFDRFLKEVSKNHKGHRWEAVRLASIERSFPWLVNIPLAKLRTDHLMEWKAKRTEQVSAGSVLREMGLLSSIFGYAKRDWNWMQHNPIEDVRRPPAPKSRNRTIAWKEIKVVLRGLGYSPSSRPSSSSEIVACAFLMALRTGMRSSEIVELEWARVRGSWVVLAETKNGTEREVPIPPKAAKIFAKLEGLDEDKPFPISAQVRDSLFRRARTRAGLDGFTFHDARHTAATRIGRTVGQPGRLSFPEFCKVFGWRDPKHALIYVNPTASELAGKM